MKKTIILFLSIVLLIPTNIFAIGENNKQNIKLNSTEVRKIEKLINTNVVSGRKEGENLHYDLGETITRAEFAKVIITTLQLNINDYKYLEPKATDVSKDHWAYNYISLITNLKNKKSGQYIMQGYPNKTFKPDSPITFAEASTILVKLAKNNLKDDLIIEREYPKNFLRWANRENIFRDINEDVILNYDDYILRKDAFHLLYNTFYKSNWKVTLFFISIYFLRILRYIFYTDKYLYMMLLF